MIYKSEEDKLWCDVFRAALVGAASALDANFHGAMVCARAADIADVAVGRIKDRIVIADSKAELFGPLKSSRSAQTAKDDEDSGFAIG